MSLPGEPTQKIARKKKRVRKKQRRRIPAESENYEEFDGEDLDTWRPLMTPRERWVKSTLAMLAALVGTVLYWWWRLDPRYEVTFDHHQGLKAGLLGWLVCVVVVVLVIRKGNRDDRKRLAAQKARRKQRRLSIRRQRKHLDNL